ncbi:dTMP kinase [Vibrio sonorensis]|uniref:dTMP kinase n=1 Tax=Vibrio sonorensis TaxID=1004316 RepID=UPI0008D9482B|nr:dTMP kinase [Vibrio sonorensis]
MKQARFIVIEGLEGAGKSTAISKVVDVLKNSGVTDVEQTREPGGTPLAETLRNLVKQDHNEEELQDMTELLMIYAARVQLVENVIKPALSKGKWVVGDRHDLSSQAYQGGGRGIPSTTMKALKETALGEFAPDLTLYMDIEPKLGLARARGRGELDRIEKMDISFFERTRDTYLRHAAEDDSIITIDAAQDIDSVARDIESKLTQWLEANG